LIFCNIEINNDDDDDDNDNDVDHYMVSSGGRSGVVSGLFL